MKEFVHMNKTGGVLLITVTFLSHVNTTGKSSITEGSNKTNLTTPNSNSVCLWVTDYLAIEFIGDLKV